MRRPMLGIAVLVACLCGAVQPAVARGPAIAVAFQLDLTALNAEISNDPLGLGYGVGTIPYDPLTEWKGDQEIADLLNAKNFVIDRASVPMEDVRGVTDFDWYDALTIDEQEFLRWKTPNSGLLLVTADVKLRLTGRTLASGGTGGTGSDANSWWAAADRTAAVAAMLPLIEVAGSRAEVLFGEGVVITAGDVGAAANVDQDALALAAH